MIGADVARLRALASEFTGAADRIEAELRTVTASVRNTPWQGPNAERFRQSWNSVHSAKLRALAAQFRDNARVLSANASDQENVSKVRDASGRAVVVPRARTSLLTIGGVTFAISGTIFDSAEMIRYLRDVRGLPVNPANLKLAMQRMGPPMSAGLKVVGGGFFVVGTALDGYQMLSGIWTGNLGQTVSGAARVAIDGISLFNPYVAAANVGYHIGEAIAPLITPHLADDIVNHHMLQQYGTADLTPSQAAQLSHRYDGISGFGHFVSDGVGSLGRRLNPFD
jgi:uncharacterized protein YukE